MSSDIKLPHDTPPRQLYAATDLGNARRLVGCYGADLRFVPSWGWVTWDGRRWIRDDTGGVMRQAKKIPVQIRAEALTRPPGSQLRKKLLDWSDRSESRARLDAMIALAES